MMGNQLFPQFDMGDILLKQDEFRPRRNYGGIYRGKVEDAADPLKRGRLRVRVNHLYHNIPVEAIPWAEACLPYGGGLNYGQVMIPPAGSTVLLAFEQEDPELPVWLGTFFGNPRGKFELPQSARSDQDPEVSAAKGTDSCVDAFNVSHTEPANPYVSKYPENNVLRTAQGIVIEYDDTIIDVIDTIGQGDGSKQNFNATLSQPPVVKNSVSVTGFEAAGLDTGTGAIVGLGVTSGTINYNTGMLFLSFLAPPMAGTPVTVSYLDQTAMPVTVGIAMGDGKILSFDTSLINVPMTAGSLTVKTTLSGGSDDGGGNIYGLGVTGSIVYKTGAVSLYYAIPPLPNVDIKVAYKSLKSRIHVYHPMGTFKEVGPKGGVVEKVQDANYLMIEMDNVQHVKGSSNEVVGVDKGIKAGGKFKVKAIGPVEIEGSTILLKTTGTGDMTVDGALNIISTASITMTAPSITLNGTSTLALNSPSGNLN